MAMVLLLMWFIPRASVSATPPESSSVRGQDARGSAGCVENRPHPLGASAIALEVPVLELDASPQRRFCLEANLNL